VGVAVTDVSGRPQAAISVSGPAARMFDTTIDAVGARLKLASEDVAERMGWRRVQAHHLETPDPVD
jgi:DNA-binding IclR family transcriptional regulator